MSRVEMRTFRYSCDGWRGPQKRCDSTCTITAFDEDEADQKILTTGWLEAGLGMTYHEAWNRDPYTDWIICSSKGHVR